MRSIYIKTLGFLFIILYSTTGLAQADVGYENPNPLSYNSETGQYGYYFEINLGYKWEQNIDGSFTGTRVVNGQEERVFRPREEGVSGNLSSNGIKYPSNTLRLFVGINNLAGNSDVPNGGGESEQSGLANAQAEFDRQIDNTLEAMNAAMDQFNASADRLNGGGNPEGIPPAELPACYPDCTGFVGPLRQGFEHRQEELFQFGNSLKPSESYKKALSLGLGDGSLVGGIKGLNANKDILGTIEDTVNRDDHDKQKEFDDLVKDVINNPPAAGASKIVYFDYQNKIVRALEFKAGTENELMAQLFKNAALKKAVLDATEQYRISQNGRDIMATGKPIDYQWSKASREQLKTVSTKAAEVSIIEKTDGDDNFWPKNAEEWKEMAELMAPLLQEVLIGFIPGSEFVDLFNGIQSGDSVEIAIAVASILVTVVGGKAIVGAIKATRVVRKATVIIRRLGRARKAAARAAKAGFKTTIEKGKLVLKKGDKVLESNEELVKEALEKIATPGARKFWTKQTTFRNVKVYKRDDIINGNLVDNAGRTNKQRMQAGIAPIGSDGKSVNLHHMLQSDAAGIAEMTETFHKTNHRTIHINPNTIPSGIDRSAFATWKRNYWKNRANDF